MQYQLELFPPVGEKSLEKETSYRCYSFDHLSPEQKKKVKTKFKVGDSVRFFFGKKEHTSKIKTIWCVFGYRYKEFAYPEYSIEGFNYIFHENELTAVFEQ